MVDEKKTNEDSIFYQVSTDSNLTPLQDNVQEGGNINVQYDKEKNKSEDVVSKAASIVYWISLFAAIIGNFVSSVILVPFIIMLENRVTLYLVVMILGLVFGALFNFLLSDIQRLDPRHRVIGGAVIPALAVINVYIMVEVAKTVGAALSINVHQNSFIISILYVAMFIIPYLISMIFRHYKLVRV